jgi:hypothetical protein
VKVIELGSETQCAGYTLGQKCKNKVTREVHTFVEKEQCEMLTWCCEYHFGKLDKGAPTPYKPLQ